MKFKGKEYTEVKDRVEAFLSEYPTSTIETELISVNNITDTPSGERCNEYMIKSTVYHVKIKHLEELDDLAKKAKPFIGEEHFLKYTKQRSDGYFDTLVRVGTTKSYLETQILDGGKNESKGSK